MAADDQPNNQFQDLVNNNNNSHQSSEESSDSFSDDHDNKKVPILLSANKLKEEEEEEEEEDLSIKNLKIPKSSEEEEEEEEEEISFAHDHHHHPSSNEFPRICKVCNKGFSSGKALGGHSRIHAQQSKKKQSLLIKNNFTHHLPPPPPPGTPTTTSTSAADSCNPNISSMNMNMNMNNKMKKMLYNNNTCSVCGKSFPSEKSLFGHMRCHPDRNWRGIQPPHHLPLITATANKNSSSSTLSEADDAEAVPRHERDDHIDSATTTTTTTNRPSSSSSVVVDLSQSLSSSWLSTAKRGRKSTLSKSRVGSGCPSGLDEQIPDEENVVHNLMMLAQGRQDSLNSGLPLSYNKQQQEQHHQITNANSSITNVMPKIDSQREEQESKKKKMKRTIDSSLINYPAKKLKIEEGVLFISNIDNSNGMKIMEKGKATQADSKDRDDLNTSSGDELIQSSCRMIHLKKKKRRKLKLRDLDTFGGLDQIFQNNNNPTVATPDRYKCTSCNKSFPTHQALGGHRSSHNKVKNIPALVKDEPDAYAAAEGLLVDAECERTHATTQVGETEEHDEEAASSRLQQGGGPYRCKVCNKTFATGQALGGHKRCHWTGPIEAPSSQVASSGEASHTGRRIPVFDLNDLPAMEDEEGVESAFAQPQHH